VIVEAVDPGDIVPGLLSDRVVKDCVAVLRPARFTVFLEFLETSVVELLFVPVVLGEELVESAFALGWKDFACDTRHGLVAGYKNTRGVAFRMMAFCW
jgi:hypothetical protein